LNNIETELKDLVGSGLDAGTVKGWVRIQFTVNGCLLFNVGVDDDNMIIWIDGFEVVTEFFSLRGSVGVFFSN